MDIRIALALDFLRLAYRSKYRIRKAKAILCHLLSRAYHNTRLFKYQCSYPLHAILLATTRCNKKCPDCFYSKVINNPEVRTDFSLEMVKESFRTNIFKSVCRVALVGGEPLLNSNLFDIIRFIKSQGVLVTLTTNALLLNSEMLKSLRNAGLDWLNISIYDDNRARIIDALNSARFGIFPVGRMALVFHSESILDFRKAYEFAEESGTHNLIFNHLYINSDSRPDRERDAFADSFDALCVEIRNKRQLRLYAHPPFRSTNDGIPRCGQAMTMVSLAPDWTLGPCCHLPPGASFGTLEDPAQLLAFKRKVFDVVSHSVCKRCYFLRSSVY